VKSWFLGELRLDEAIMKTLGECWSDIVTERVGTGLCGGRMIEQTKPLWMILNRVGC
jgi:hypothetical protein